MQTQPQGYGFLHGLNMDSEGFHGFLVYRTVS